MKPMTPIRRWTAVAAAAMYCASGATAQEPAAPPEKPKVESVKALYATGSVMEIREVYKDAAGKKVNHGLYQFFFDNGQKREEVYYKHGKRQGPCIFWHRNGQKECETTFEDDLRQGTEKWFESDGVKYAEFQHKDDVADGDWIWFYPDGRKAQLETYAAGVKQGPWTWWNPNGKIGVQGQYLEDEMDGEWSLFDADGKLSETRKFKKGQWLNPPKLNPPAPGREGALKKPVDPE